MKKIIAGLILAAATSGTLALTVAVPALGYALLLVISVLAVVWAISELMQ